MTFVSGEFGPSYKDAPFHAICNGGCLMGGDILARGGNADIGLSLGSVSIYGKGFPVEYKHRRASIVGYDDDDDDDANANARQQQKTSSAGVRASISALINMHSHCC